MVPQESFGRLKGNYTYAMKFFEDEEGSFTIEMEYAELGLGLHPHIILALDQSLCALNKNCHRDITNWKPRRRDHPGLFMELLDGSLDFGWHGVTCITLNATTVPTLAPRWVARLRQG